MDTFNEGWRTSSTFSTNGMCAEYAVGIAANIDVQHLKCQCVKSIVHDMMPAAKSIIAKLEKAGEIIARHEGGRSHVDFVTRRGKIINVKGSGDFKHAEIFPNGGGQTSSARLHEVHHMPICDVKNGKAVFQQEVLKNYKQLIASQIANIFQANYLVAIMFHKGEWRDIVIRNDEPDLRRIILDNIQLVHNPDKSEWEGFNMVVIYNHKCGPIKLARFASQPNRDSHTISIMFSSLLYLTGVMPFWADSRDCAIVKNPDRITNPPNPNSFFGE